MNIAEFAKIIGVSPTAVSFAINNKQGHISSATRQMILTRMEELGYRPNHLARALATQRTRTIAFWTFDVYPPYYTQTLYHIRQLLMAEDYDIHIINLSHLMQSARSSSWPVDGIICHAGNTTILEMMNAGLFEGIPIVEMGHFMESTDHIHINTYDASVEAVEHLVKTGRRRIAYLLPDWIDPLENERSVAYSTVLKGAGLEPEYIFFDSPKTTTARPGTRDRIKEYVKEHGCPDAMVGCNDEAAIGAYRGLRDLGIRIPDDVALIGCDGIEDTEYVDPQLSTIIQPVQQMCETAWDFLKKRMADPTIPQQACHLYARLALRGSSDAPSS